MLKKAPSKIYADHGSKPNWDNQILYSGKQKCGQVYQYILNMRF